jgi:dihydrolipoamide dehydrogenase
MARYDVAIIGGGPGGYVAAIRAAQLGLKAALIEKDRIGGLCLNWGCIPSKALLYNAQVLRLCQNASEFGISFDNLRYDLGFAVDRSRQVADRMVSGVEFLLKKHKVTVIEGSGRLRGRQEIEVSPSGEIVEAENVIIATGAHARALPGVPIDGRTVITSREALELREPPASIVIVGGGPVGVEFAYLYRAYGSEVTVVEMLDRLVPTEDEEISRRLEQAFRKQGIRAVTGAQVSEVRVQKGKAKVQVSTDGGQEELVAAKVLVGIGVTANSDRMGLDELGVAMENGFIQIDEGMETSLAGTHAIGDVTGKLLLAHVASAQGVVAVEAIARRDPPALDYDNMPRATYCQPQVASLGLTEAQARDRGHRVKVGRFPFRANGKALAMGESEGMVKLVVDEEYGDILGYHMIGPEVTELLGEASLGKTMEATAREMGLSVHAHPTLSETLKEAALSSYGEAVHFWREQRATE